MTQVIPSKIGLNRLVGVIIAIALLNVGLFFVLYIFAPLLAGLIGGYILLKKRESIITGFVGTLAAFLPMMLVTLPAQIQSYIDSSLYLPEEIPGAMPFIITILLLAALLISGLGALGGYLGHYISERTFTSQQDESSIDD